MKFGKIISDGISYIADTNEGSAYGRTDTQNFGRYNIIPSPLFVAGHKNVRFFKLVLAYYICGKNEIV